uniref:Uncharacterized protein AlNc14C215G8999 n=1 Tax=Albugo laibachii Nc14 TaxID=890382 RepID=F0WRJ9_9STRA|nr:conserved hypothetical protein [Albugo laibachii Nc14]|eukprot:CCA23962.1 conserved hypothetical protein [Albugo laibachii Nc14]
MSSLAAARADNFYYPKDFDPKKHQSVNKYHNSHPLGKRAKDLHTDGVLVVRFEMPFHVWCTHCDEHIGRGVRYNAKKRHVGDYYSTKIYEFRLKCANCQGVMVIETDPAARDYRMVSGVRKHEQMDSLEASVIAEMGVERVEDPSVRSKLQEDPFFYKLEHEQVDRDRAKQRSKGLQAVIAIQEAQFQDDYSSNAALRRSFRAQKREIKKKEDAASRLGLSIPLLDVTEEDRVRAKSVSFKRITGRKRDKHSMRLVAKFSSKTDSFQHFGDQKASQLHRFRLARTIKPTRKQT